MKSVKVKTMLKKSGYGYEIGPKASGRCPGCRHTWGEHDLHPEGEQLEGGTYTCPECTCWGTWNLKEKKGSEAKYIAVKPCAAGRQLMAHDDPEWSGRCPRVGTEFFVTTDAAGADIQLMLCQHHINSRPENAVSALYVSKGVGDESL